MKRATPTKIIGHRGAKGLAPENTVASMHKALEYGVNEIEIDARITRDGVVVVAHNEDIADQADNKLIISEHDYDELKAHKSDLATLEEIIAAINRVVPLIIEIKPGVAVSPIARVVQGFLQRGWEPQDFLIASFDIKILQAAKAQLPAITVVVNEHWSGLRATYRARQLGTKRIAMNQKMLWWGYISLLHARGYELYPYTVNDPKQQQRYVRYGSAGIYTDYPDYFSSAKTL